MGFAMKGERRPENGALNSDLKSVAPAAIHNPYLAARREWDERYGDLLTRARNWRTVAVICALVALVALAVAPVPEPAAPVALFAVSGPEVEVAAGRIAECAAAMSSSAKRVTSTAKLSEAPRAAAMTADAAEVPGPSSSTTNGLSLRANTASWKWRRKTPIAYRGFSIALVLKIPALPRSR